MLQFHEELGAIRMIKMAPLSDLTITEIREATAGDAALQTVAHFTQRGWSENKSDVPSGLLPYFKVRDELSVEQGLLFRGSSDHPREHVRVHSSEAVCGASWS